MLRRLLANEEGQTLAEYGMLLALIAVAAVAAVTGIGTAIAGQIASIAGSL
jgi:pilus assembly protein Flp/PilA